MDDVYGNKTSLKIDRLAQKSSDTNIYIEK